MGPTSWNNVGVLRLPDPSEAWTLGASRRHFGLPRTSQRDQARASQRDQFPSHFSVSDRSTAPNRASRGKLKSKYLTKHLTNPLTYSSTVRSTHDLIHNSLCMDMHRTTLVYISIHKFPFGPGRPEGFGGVRGSGSSEKHENPGKSGKSGKIREKTENPEKAGNIWKETRKTLAKSGKKPGNFGKIRISCASEERACQFCFELSEIHYKHGFGTSEQLGKNTPFGKPSRQHCTRFADSRLHMHRACYARVHTSIYIYIWLQQRNTVQ